MQEGPPKSIGKPLKQVTGFIKMCLLGKHKTIKLNIYEVAQGAHVDDYHKSLSQ